MKRTKKLIMVGFIFILLGATLPINRQGESLFGVLFGFTVRGFVSGVVSYCRLILCRYDLQYTWVYDCLTRFQCWVDPVRYGVYIPPPP